MPIRPIDMLSMPNRSQEASQVHQAENNKLIHAQEQLGVQYNSNIKHNGQQTVKLNKSENQEFRYKDGRKNESQYSSSQRNKKKKQEDNDKEIKLSNFDLRI